MNERELLENAAKAAGIDTTRCLQYGDGAFDWPGKAGRWNPLTDDGDAFRLAVKLHLPVEAMIAFVAEREPDWVEDPYAATRRAIVKAAAEIGKAMV